MKAAPSDMKMEVLYSISVQYSEATRLRTTKACLTLIVQHFIPSLSRGNCKSFDPG